jgi:hypothetical protein
VRYGTIQRHAYVGWFNNHMYFHDFHTVLYESMTFENCKNIYSSQWFLAMARKLVFLDSHSG